MPRNVARAPLFLLERPPSPLRNAADQAVMPRADQEAVQELRAMVGLERSEGAKGDKRCFLTVQRRRRVSCASACAINIFNA